MKKRIRISVGQDEWALLESEGIYYNLGIETYKVMMVNRIPQLKVGYTALELDNHIRPKEGWMAWRAPPLHHPLTVPDYRFPSTVVVESVPTHGGEEE